MAVNFDELNLSVQDKSKNVVINGQKVEVKQYLPIEDKINLIQIILQQGTVDGMFDEGMLEALFYVYTIMYYTDLEFTDEQKQNPLNIYDILITNNTLDAILAAIPKDEFVDLMEYFEKQKELNLKYQTSFVYIINSFLNKVNDLTKNLNDKDVEAIIEKIKSTLTESALDK